MHAYRHRVRYHEADAQGFLFNARDLEVADVAMTEYLRAVGLEYQSVLDRGFDPSLVTSTVDFRRPAHYDDELDVDVVCTRVGTSSFTLRFAMTRDGEPVCDVESVYVNVDTATETSRPLPADIAAVLRGE